MQVLRNLPKSPLGRHPRLFVRKVAERFGLYREDTPIPPAPPVRTDYPSHWLPALEEWTRQIPLKPGPHPFNRLFGHEFDEAVLLQLCREGPRRHTTGLLADIKLPWEYSRGQPLVTNALLGPAHAAHCVAFLRRWLDANGDTCGVNWNCAMEVAIRAVNWIVADALFRGALARELGSDLWSAWLWRHGQAIWRRLESRLVSSNHYLADLLGLAVIGAALPEDRSAKAWRRFVQAEFPRALLSQTYRDGGLTEASLRYHAYVTEMALLVRLAQGSPFPDTAEARLHDMCQIVADFQDSTGDVFPMGDDDSGRVLALDFASDLGRREILLRLASVVLQRQFKPAEVAVYPETGWCVRTFGDFRLALDFGGVGLAGLGGHAHNDDLSFCLDWKSRPVIVDPGTYLYTSDPASRNRFRSTAAHNTVIVDGSEQRPLTPEMFQLRGSVASHAFTNTDSQWCFTRNTAQDVSHRRQIRSADGGIVISDSITSGSRHDLEWSFVVHPDIRAEKTASGFALSLSDGSILQLEADPGATGLDYEVVAAEYSPAYGHRQPTQRCRARIAATNLEVNWRIRPSGHSLA